MSYKFNWVWALAGVLLGLALIHLHKKSGSPLLGGVSTGGERTFRNTIGNYTGQG